MRPSRECTVRAAYAGCRCIGLSSIRSADAEPPSATVDVVALRVVVTSPNMLSGIPVAMTQYCVHPAVCARTAFVMLTPCMLYTSILLAAAFAFFFSLEGIFELAAFSDSKVDPK